MLPPAPTATSSVPFDRPIAGDGSHADCWRLALLGFVGFGVLLRLARYLLDFPLWGDEAFLAASFIDRDFASVLERLEYNMVAPPLFLWAELAAVRLFDFSEMSLRLVPTVASLLCVFLFWRLASQWFRGFPLLFAVALFSVSYYPIRHGNEVKPYATDLLAALVLLVLASQWLQQPGRQRWLYALALASVPAVLGSFTAVFVAGGLSLALLPALWRLRDWRNWTAFVVYNLCLVASFATVYAVSVQTQYSSYDAAGLKTLWNHDFPPLDQPLALLAWLVDRHTGHMFAYPNGGGNYASAGTTLLLLVGSLIVWRRGPRVLLAICWLPLAVCLAAASLERYPYGGSARTMQFIAPAVCLLAGLGIAALLAGLRHHFARRWGTIACAALLMLFGWGIFARDLTAPYKTVYDQRSREFARWFWREQARDAVLVCVKRDLGVVFNPAHWEYDRTAVYQCQQRIYAQQQTRPAAAEIAAVSARRPLRCVLYNEHPVGDPRFAAWLESLGVRYALCDRREYFVNRDVVVRGAPYEDHFVVYEFVPRGDERPPIYTPPAVDPSTTPPPQTARRRG